MKQTFQAILANYGGRAGLLRHLIAKIAYFLGFYSRYENVDYSRVKRLVFICKGNICRSPYAEFRARKTGLFSTSAGLHAKDGKKADPIATKISDTRTLSLITHEAKSLASLHIESSDLLIAFEPWQARELERFQYENGAQVTLMGLFLEEKMPFIQDPYMMPENYFQKCFERIDRAIENLSKNIRSKK